jgi:hypothetical protein
MGTVRADEEISQIVPPLLRLAVICPSVVLKLSELRRAQDAAMALQRVGQYLLGFRLAG